MFFLTSQLNFPPSDGPKNVTLSLSSSYVLEGGSVTFTCSSDANPKVKPELYELYKGLTLVSSEQSHIISNVQKHHEGQYKCWAKNDIISATSAPVQLEVNVSMV